MNSTGIANQPNTKTSISTTTTRRKRNVMRSSSSFNMYSTGSIFLVSMLLIFSSISKLNDSCRSYSEALATPSQSLPKSSSSSPRGLGRDARPNGKRQQLTDPLRGGSASSLYETKEDQDLDEEVNGNRFNHVNGGNVSGAGIRSTDRKIKAKTLADFAKSQTGFGTALLESDEEFGARIDHHIDTEYIAETNLPTDVGYFRLRAYRIEEKMEGLMRNRYIGREPCVIYAADKPPFGQKSVPVRIHDQCFTSEVFRSQRCDCKEQLKMALEHVQRHGGAVIYLQQEGRGIGIANKVAAYALQDRGYDTVDANTHLGFPEDCRQYGVVPSILSEMGIESVRLMTNNPRKIERLTALGIDVEGTVPMVVPKPTAFNRKYLQTKQDRMNHRNFGEMLSMDQRQSSDIINDAMVSIRTTKEDVDQPFSVADNFINDGEEMAAAAITSALFDSQEVILQDVQQAGVSADDSGYCFGKKSVEEAIAAVARGELIVVVDDMDRENEGDFIMAADLATPETMAAIVRYSSGVVCIGMEAERMDELELPAMLKNNEDPKGTAFSVTVDASPKHGITTGISAADRALTMKILADPSSKPDDLVRPGHIFPLRAREGGVLTRDGHTEAAVDLSRLAGRHPSGILCEIVSEEHPTEMARLPELKRFCKKHGYVLTSIVDLAQYRKDTEK